MAWSLDDINFNFSVNFSDIEKWQGDKIISTLPMSTLLMILRDRDNKAREFFKKSQFESRTGTVIRAKLPEEWDVYATLYFPDSSFLPYRASITGNELIIEIVEESENLSEDKAYAIAQYVTSAFGIGPEVLEKQVAVKKQRFAKILNIDERERKEFIIWATEKWGIYSLGRFATWRPGLLLDDVVHDVRVIQQIMKGDNSKIYEGKKANA
jgi:protoporphyrinogen oxidase